MRTTTCLLAALFPPAIAAQSPDLIVVAIDRDRLTGDWQVPRVQGDLVVTVRNRDSGGSAACQLTVFEDSNGSGTFDPADRVLANAAVPALAFATSTRITVPLATPVRFRDDLIWAMVDSGNAVAESSEGNNVASTAVNLTLQPVLKWSWTNPTTVPASVNVMVTPLCCDLDGDGFPEVVFTSSSYSGIANQFGGELRAVDGRTGAERWTVTTHQIVGSFTPAIGNLDSDPQPEIVCGLMPGNRLVCFEHDGTFKWQSAPVENFGFGAACIADLNQDGTAEVIVGRQVLDNLGNLLWTGSGGSHGSLAKAPYVADVDFDGMNEVVCGSTVYGPTGLIESNLGAQFDWFTAAGNFDGDSQAEIVCVSNGLPYLRNHDGSTVWNPPAGVATAGRGGAPTIADFDGDGRPEIGIAGNTVYRVFETDGTLLWQQTIRDGSSHMTPAAAFDFDADGTLDVVFRDETTLWIFRGTDGAVLFSRLVGSCTWNDGSMVADVDADGSADLVIGGNDSCFASPQRGVYVFSSVRASWPATRKVWNQFNYSITNVLENGAIPQQLLPNWLTPAGTPHNNFRVNPALSQPNNRFADLTASVLVLPCQGPQAILVRIGNGGLLPAPAGVPVEFWLGAPPSGTLLGTTFTPALASGQWLEVGIPYASSLTSRVYVVIDPLDALAESNEANNRYDALPCQVAALAANYGNGWPGTLGVPSFTTSALPQLGSTPQLMVGNSAGVPTFAAFLLGGSQVSLPSGYGGTVLADPLVTSAFFLPPGQQGFTFVVPRLPSACGATYWLQVVEIDAGASHGIAFSRGLRVVFGR